jgi:saccharopine dehydrogenase-like NADP-dependent oxidoreductase
LKLLVIASGMMGSAAGYDMCRNPAVVSVTLADADLNRAREAAARIYRMRGGKKVKAVALDASSVNGPPPC